MLGLLRGLEVGLKPIAHKEISSSFPAETANFMYQVMG